ncbi:MAG TPA: hypothetical protein VGU20_11430 [Stellaceae bacterium]|nr:hypothetical protein [Stellaceae bacterium]
MSDAAIDVFPVSASFVPPIEPAPSRTHAWKDGGSFSFHDLLDTINPLQHIPVVSAIYRWLTGDTPGNVARIVGDGLFGGPLGLAAGAISVAVKEETGKDPGELALALVSGESNDGAKTQVAAADPAASGAAAAPSLDAPAAPPAPITAAPVAAAPPLSAAAPAAPTAAPGSTAIPFTADAHPPIPLFKGAPSATPARATGAPSAAEQAFLAQNAFFQRTAQRQSMTGRPITAPIALQLTGQALPGAARPTPTVPIPSPASSVSGVSQSGPVDMPQRMLDALDKYMQLQQQKPPRGGEIDLAP